jgi:hypothetical protein
MANKSELLLSQYPMAIGKRHEQSVPLKEILLQWPDVDTQRGSEEAFQRLHQLYFRQLENEQLFQQGEKISSTSIENDPQELQKYTQEHPFTFTSSLELLTQNKQQQLIDAHYSEEAEFYSDIYYMTDEEALAKAKAEGKEAEFLPYRNVSLACDEILKDWEGPLIENTLTREANIVDFGSGTGDTIRFFPFIPPWRYQGYDIAHRMVTIAREQHPNHFFTQANTQELRLKDNSYGILVANYGPPAYWKGTEDVAGLQQEAAKMFDKLDDQGMVCLGLYSHKVRDGLPFEESTTKKELEMGIEINFYTTEQAVQYLKQAGFPYVVARGMNFDSTQRAWEEYQKTGKIYPPSYWKEQILKFDQQSRAQGKEEHEARHFYVFGSKKPFQLVENGHIVYSSQENDVFTPQSKNQ